MADEHTQPSEWPKPTRRLPSFGLVPRTPANVRYEEPAPPQAPPPGTRLARVVDIRRANAVACLIGALALVVDGVVVDHVGAVIGIAVVTAIYVVLSRSDWVVRSTTPAVDLEPGMRREPLLVTAAHAVVFPAMYVVVAIGAQRVWDEHDAVFPTVFAAWLFRFAITNELRRRSIARLELTRGDQLYARRMNQRGRTVWIWARGAELS